MSKLIIALVITCFAACTAFAENTTATKAAAPSSAAGTSVTAEGKMTARMMEAYQAAGLSDEQIAKLKDINNKLNEARAKGEKVDLKVVREERDKILTPAQNEKIRAYIKGHPTGAAKTPKGK